MIFTSRSPWLLKRQQGHRQQFRLFNQSQNKTKLCTRFIQSSSFDPWGFRSNSRLRRLVNCNFGYDNKMMSTRRNNSKGSLNTSEFQYSTSCKVAFVNNINSNNKDGTIKEQVFHSKSQNNKKKVKARIQSFGVTNNDDPLKEYSLEHTESLVIKKLKQMGFSYTDSLHYAGTMIEAELRNDSSHGMYAYIYTSVLRIFDRFFFV